MATIKKIEIRRNWGERPTGNSSIIGEVFFGVEKGQRYDLIQFSINELHKPYLWFDSIGVPLETSEEECRRIATEFASKITDKDIKEYTNFLEDGEKYGWD